MLIKLTCEQDLSSFSIAPEWMINSRIRIKNIVWIPESSNVIAFLGKRDCHARFAWLIPPSQCHVDNFHTWYFSPAVLALKDLAFNLCAEVFVTQIAKLLTVASKCIFRLNRYYSVPMHVCCTVMLPYVAHITLEMYIRYFPWQFPSLSCWRETTMPWAW